MSVPSPQALWRSVVAVAGRPDLWPVAAAMAWRLAPERWWRRRPPLPVPDAAYWDYRMTTAYGGEGSAGSFPSDVVEYLEWCAARRRRGRRALR